MILSFILKKIKGIKMKMYGIPNCDTVKKARKYLESKKVEFDFVDFKKSPPTISFLENVKKTIGELPVNKKGITYKKYKEEYEKLNEDKKLQFLIEHSSMIKRPILEKANKILALGFSEDEYLKWIK